MRKMHQNTFGGRAQPGPAGEIMRSQAALGASKFIIQTGS